MMQWEYSVLNIGAIADAEDIKSTLNALGKEGWELVAALAKADGSSSSGFLFLKRRKAN